MMMRQNTHAMARSWVATWNGSELSTECEKERSERCAHEARFEDDVELCRYGFVYLAVNKKKNSGWDQSNIVKFIIYNRSETEILLSFSIGCDCHDQRNNAKHILNFLCDDLLRRLCMHVLANGVQRGNTLSRLLLARHECDRHPSFHSKFPFQSNQSLLFILCFSFDCFEFSAFCILCLSSAAARGCATSTMIFRWLWLELFVGVVCACANGERERDMSNNWIHNSYFSHVSNGIKNFFNLMHDAHRHHTI